MSMEDMLNKWKQNDLVEQIKQRMNIKGNSEDSKVLQMMLTGIEALKMMIYVMEVKNGQFYYVFANQMGLEFLQMEEVDSLEGKKFEEVLSQESAEYLTSQYEKAASSKSFTSFENEVQLQNGHKMKHETFLTSFSEQGNRYIFALVQDVTDKAKELEEITQLNRRLDEKEQLFNSLPKNSNKPFFMFNKGGYFLELNEATEAVTGYSDTHLVGKHFSKIVHPHEQKKVEEKFRLALQGKTVEYETTIYHKDGHEVVVSVENVPLVINGELKGVYGIAMDMTQQKKDMDGIQQEKMIYQSFLEDNSDSICIINKDKKVQYVNRAYVTDLGYTAEEVIGQEMPAVPDWLKKETDDLYDEVLQGNKRKAFSVQRQKKSGGLIDLSLTLSPIYDETGDIIGIACSGRDITEIKRKASKLMKEKEELEHVWNLTSTAFCLIGYNGEILRANTSFEEMFHLNLLELQKPMLSDIQPEYFHNQIESFLKRLQENNKPIYLRTKQLRKDGKEFDVEVSYNPVQKGNVLAVVSYVDVTDSTSTLNEIKENAETYKQIVETIPEAMMIHQEGRVKYINEKGLELLKAKNPNQVIDQDVLTFVHPKFHNQVLERMQLVEKDSLPAEPLEEIFINLEGGSFYADALNTLIKFQGKDSVLVMARDISSRKRAEKNLKETEERFRIIAENSMDIIKIVSPEGRITFASPAVESILGYPVRDMVGKMFSKFVHPDDVERINQAFTSLFETKENLEIEVRRKHVEGYSIWLHSHLIPIVDDKGELDKIVVISRDITDNKRKEEKLSKMAYYDQLTGLPNRRLFNDHLEQAMYTTDRTGKQTALFVLDCDKFKEINDTLGHDVGDEVIKEFANRVKSCIRKTDTLSRLGGDEFTIVLPELKNEIVAVEVANRILKKVKEPMHINGHQIEITASIGIAFYPLNGRDFNRLFKEADENLYEAKDRGGDTMFSRIY
ncbi:sensor domain-containing diguanylate cyclase [Oceanobacillus halophilus]|uniref:PAS domain S-box protein n=1 Tax=Oceanobacillus halophilus TaxID=930130 RepID=A0A495A045_9BACI|nr:sensor domain-containing diguanylate cyclase [Oceanobacillus halophilus]RKQ32650.1 PAS domain S-box protein [Oceanobacillus halophilus]